MNTAEKTQDEVEVMQPQKEQPVAKREESKPSLEAGGKVAAIIPRNVEETYRLANILFQSNMTPNSYKSVEQTMVGIMKGLEVGMTPLTALQSIYVVNGIPTIWGDGALALVRASGLLEDFLETFDEENEIAVCTIKRKGEKSPVVGKFKKEDATRAGLLNKSGPWQQYRPRMYQMRARAFALRDAFADILRGLKITEEVVDYTNHDLVKQADGSFTVASSVEHVENPLDDDGPEQEVQPEPPQEAQQEPEPDTRVNDFQKLYAHLETQVKKESDKTALAGMQAAAHADNPWLTQQQKREINGLFMTRMRDLEPA